MKYALVFLFLFTVLHTAFAGDNNRRELRQTVTELEQAGYTDLFQRMTMENADRIWKNGDTEDVLLQIISDENAYSSARFLAAELLYHYRGEIPREYEILLPSVYANALRNLYPDNGEFNHCFPAGANPWGFLFEMDDPGWLGPRIIHFGETAVPHLLALLDNDSPVLYEGSHEALVGNGYGYRIKDFAYYYLLKISGESVDFEPEAMERNRDIWRFRREILDRYGPVDKIRIDYYANFLLDNPSYGCYIEDPVLIKNITTVLNSFPDEGKLFIKIDPASPLTEIHLFLDDVDIQSRSVYGGRLQLENSAYAGEEMSAQQERLNTLLEELRER